MTILVGLVLTGCTGVDGAGEPSAARSDPEEASVKVFEGTPEERVTLVRACLDDAGLRTVDDPMGDPLGYGYSKAGRDPAEVAEIRDRCDAEVGVPKMAGLSEDELRERYDARVEQDVCLREHGYTVVDRPSFDRFVDDYERSGQQLLWEPAALPDPKPGDNPTIDCPRASW